MRILFIVPATLEALHRKFGNWQPILDRNEGGRVEKVVTVHLQAERTRTVTLDPQAGNNVVHEFGLDWFPWPPAWRTHRIGRWLSYLFAPLYLLRVVAGTCRLVRRERLMLIRSLDTGLGAGVAWLVARITGIPWCISIHAPLDGRQHLRTDREHLLGSEALGRKVRHLFLPHADIVLPIRESMIDDLVQLGVARERIRVIPHGVDMAALQRPPATDVRARYGLPADAPLVSFAGRLTGENYVQDVLDIAAAVGRTRDDVRFVLAGDGVAQDEVRRRVEADPLLRRMVVLPGFEPQQVVFDLRRASAVNLCLMAGFSLIEACASGRPCVSYDVEWHYELVRDGETGFLVPERQAALAAERVLWLLDHPEKATRMGEAARVLAMQRHDKDAASETKLACYREMLHMADRRTARPLSPQDGVAASNPWYLGDQWKDTWECPSYKAIILDRWECWRRYVAQWLPEYRKALAGDARPLRVLDAGCGDGVNLSGLRQIFTDLAGEGCTLTDHAGEGCAFTGMDYNLLRLERASVRYTDVELTEGDLTRLAVPDATYDCILCNHVLEHIADDMAALRELRRVLRLGGLLLLGVPNEGCLMAQARNRVFQRDILRTTDHVNFYTLATLVSRVRAAGWEVRATDRQGFFLPRTELHSLLGAWPAGRRIEKAIGRLLPGQASDMQLALVAAPDHIRPAGNGAALGRNGATRNGEA